MTSKNAINQFISLEVASGILLLFMLIIALIFANTALSDFYNSILDIPLHVGIGPYEARKPILLWVNEGLMAIFFMLLALEVKREVITGEMSKLSKFILPIAGALGGIILPVLIFVLLNHGHPLKMRGWPIATTTDIAFALGVVALLGNRVSPSLKITLVTLSIVDDILAVIIIAAYYTDTLSWMSMILSLLGLVALVVLNICKVQRIAAYMLVGGFIWIFVLKSGIHATLAGVAIGLTIPYKSTTGNEYSPLMQLEKSLHPWVAFAILPLFVFLNGGVSFAGFSWQAMTASVPLGIALGLLLGKTFGAFFFCWLVIKLKWAKLPTGASLMQLLGILALTGIGFTMSLFIASLAYNQSIYEEAARQGILIGSLLACLFSVIIFSCIKNRSQPELFVK